MMDWRPLDGQVRQLRRCRASSIIGFNHLSWRMEWYGLREARTDASRGVRG
jgi:hypothetical protein